MWHVAPSNPFINRAGISMEFLGIQFHPSNADITGFNFIKKRTSFVHFVIYLCYQNPSWFHLPVISLNSRKHTWQSFFFFLLFWMVTSMRLWHDSIALILFFYFFIFSIGESLEFLFHQFFFIYENPHIHLNLKAFSFLCYIVYW